MADREGVLSFLLITFGITYLAEGVVILSAFRLTAIPAACGQFIIAGAMWIPAAAAIIAVRFVTHEKWSSLGLRLGPSWRPYLATVMINPRKAVFSNTNC